MTGMEKSFLLRSCLRKKLWSGIKFSHG